MKFLVVNESEIRNLVTIPEAIEAMEMAFASYSKKEANVPPVIHLDVPERQGEVHIKAGHIRSTREWVLKVATGFWQNRSLGLPISSGLMLVFSAETGIPQAMLMDNCYLTDLRTAAAGAVAAKYMAKQTVEQIGVFGGGMQGRFQVRALHHVRPFKRALVYDHHTTNVVKYISEMEKIVPAEFRAADTPQDAAAGSDVLIGCTPSRQPYLRAEWIQPGTHITAMGSDDPGKQELEAKVLQKADRIIADSLVQCVKLGEIHHAIDSGVLAQADVDGELGDVILGTIPGRANDREITVCDLTGVGVQDAAIAQLVYRRALDQNIGTWLEL